MRKVTGYIGALIVVVALMGSVLAGYALNINGQSVVVNEYENVTDVSGLYSHTDEKTYIDYNPASNYIGYSEQPVTFTNEIQDPNYRYTSVTTGTIYIAAGAGINVNGMGYYWTDSGTDTWKVIGEGFFVYGSISDPIITGAGFSFTHVTSMLMDINLPTITFSWYDGVNPDIQYYTVNNIDYVFGYDPVNYDYVGSNTNDTDANRQIYLNDASQVYGLAVKLSIDTWGSFNNTTWTSANDGSTYPIQPVSLSSDLGENIKEYTVNSTVSDYSRVLTIYPHTVKSTGGGMGIDYIESNRVNNYPVAPTQSQYDVTTFKQVNLQAQSVANYATPGRDWFLGNDGYEPRSGPSWVSLKFYAPNYNGSTRVDNIKVNNLATLIDAVEKPAGAKLIRIDMGAPNALQTITYPVPTGEFTMYRDIASNFVAIGPYAYTYPYALIGLNGVYYYHSSYYVCDLQTGMTQMFNGEGTLTGTFRTSDLYVQYITSATNGGLVEYLPYEGQSPSIQNSYYTCQSARAAPYLNFTITSSNTVVTPHYMDITKGMAIKSDNIGNTVWNNEYENGVIDILFRAEDTSWAYHNDLTISGNDIAVDYNLGRFSVTLNDNDPVDIGTWRNIILHIDLINGELSVRPVRTFNSYSNVVMDNASIEIGELVNAAPTNTITWAPTSNSFRFNIYSTSVFMDTYGVVMVNPSLEITNYFPNLDNFYRLYLHNFTIYGDSITVNGQTGTVSNNILTMGGESFIMKDVSITYADGHAYLDDSHATIDLGEITSNDITLNGVWYFETALEKGYTALKQIYTWDWETFILDNTQFCVFYIGLALVGLVAARRFCIMTVIDYAVLITSIIIALSTQVIA